MKGAELALLAVGGYLIYRQVAQVGGSISDALNPQNWVRGIQDSISDVFSGASNNFSGVIDDVTAASGAPFANLSIISQLAAQQADNTIYAVQNYGFGSLIGSPDVAAWTDRWASAPFNNPANYDASGNYVGQAFSATQGGWI